MSAIAAPPQPKQRPHARSSTPRRTVTVLGGYRRHDRDRQIVAVARADGATVVVDWIAGTRSDSRLVGEIAADEPAGNARILARLYLDDASKGRCRRLRREDLHPPRASPASHGSAGGRWAAAQVLRDRGGQIYTISRLPRSGHSSCELRWTRRQDGDDGEPEAVTLRSVIGALESYEPARAITATAIEAHRHDPSVSIEALRLELRRLAGSSTVLNRGLREAVQEQIAAGRVSMSEIAIRCERVKRHPGGQLSGETSWLARRIGLAAENGHATPTPWVHTDVLALIARCGLHVCPREVELG
jgi:hypothetical protein